ncbi:MAG TPA: signal recognition particle protein, partial [Thermoanaerobaculia bacterium]|nr:signal recognition particle protein [Thermoanaerobaculia bacterium]
DMRDQLRQVRRMGPLTQLMELMPKVGPFKALSGAQVDDKQLVRTQAMLDSMTPKERRKPAIISASRKKRIARGSGTRVQDVNQLLRQFKQMRKTMKRLKGSGLGKLLGGGGFPGGGGGGGFPGGGGGFPGGGGGFPKLPGM